LLVLILPVTALAARLLLGGTGGRQAVPAGEPAEVPAQIRTDAASGR
jgi:hypothetical protein